MYTTPTQYLSEDLNQRCFVKFAYEGNSYRLYNGKSLEMNCFPNRKKTIIDRKRELKRLLEATYKALQAGWYPGKVTNKVDEVPKLTLIESIQLVETDFQTRGWAISYLRDMKRIANELINFLNVSKLNRTSMEQITTDHLSQFLNNYRSSARYYMNKRRNLSALFTLLLKGKQNLVALTPTMKTREVLNQAYTPEQLIAALKHYLTMSKRYFYKEELGKWLQRNTFFPVLLNL